MSGNEKITLPYDILDYHIFILIVGYVLKIYEEVVRLRHQYNTLKKANIHAKHTLLAKPATLVDSYLEGKERLD